MKESVPKAKPVTRETVSSTTEVSAKNGHKPVTKLAEEIANSKAILQKLQKQRDSFKDTLVTDFT